MTPTTTTDIASCDQHVLHMSNLCGHQDDCWYVSVYDAEWRNVHSRAQSERLHVSLLYRPRCVKMIWFSNNTSKSGEEQISMKETCGLCEGRAEQHSLHLCESVEHHVHVWLVSSTLDSVEGRAWTANTATVSRECSQRIRYVT